MSDEARELLLYAENDRTTYDRSTVPTSKAVQRHYDRGNGNPDLTIKAFEHVATFAAKRYVDEFGSPDVAYHEVFPVSVRREVAAELAESFLAEYNIGNRY